MLLTHLTLEKLETLTRVIEALQKENAALRKDLSLFEETLETLTNHGLDLDSQMADVYGRLRALEKKQILKREAPHLTLVRGHLDAYSSSVIY